MRIISEFHDYYDVVQAMGQDQTVVYVRKSEEVYYDRPKDWPFPQLQMQRHWEHGKWLWAPSVQQYIVGFCGKIYPVLLMDGYQFYKGKLEGCVCFTVDDVDRYVESKVKKEALEEYYYKKPKKAWRMPRHRFVSVYARHEVFEAYFAKCAEVQADFEYIFVEHKCPIFLASRDPVSRWEAERHGDGGKIVYNACLRDVGFFRLFDPPTAFQEISMYFGNIAQPNRPIPEVSDKDMAVAKGFNKWSFRKEPTK